MVAHQVILTMLPKQRKKLYQRKFGKMGLRDKGKVVSVQISRVCLYTRVPVIYLISKESEVTSLS